VELAARPIPRTRAIAESLYFDGRALGAFTLGFAPVLYLALRGGGYDTVVYSETGLAAWWIVLLGALAGVLPLSRLGRVAWVTGGLLAAFAFWTGLASGWSSSAEQTIAQLGRVATYLGFFVLALCVVRRDTIRTLVTGMAAAFGVVGLLAVLSRLYPGAFPTDTVAQFFGAHARLDYPLNYADGTGNFLAIGLPLLLAVATRARRLPGQALGAAAIPVAVLAVVMTASRGAVLTAIVGIIVFYLLAPDRLPKVATGLVAAAGSAILVGGLLHRSGLREGLSTSTAVTQRHQETVLLVVVSIGVALVQVAIGLAARYTVRPPELRIGRRQAGIASVAALAVAVVIAVAAGVPGDLKHDWNVFKSNDVTGVVQGNTLSRLVTIGGSNRYQYWRTAVKAFDSKPVSGIGPGTFQFYWAQHAPLYEYIRNAHSLYLETLAETGLVGGVILIGFLLTLLGLGVVRALRAPPLARVSLAAATAMLFAFCVASGYDWMWQLPCAPVAALLLGAGIVMYREAGSEHEAEDGAPRSRVLRDWAPRSVLVVVSVAALISVAIPFAMTSSIRSSQSAAGSGNLKGALNDALTAQRLEPYAASPRLQEALVLEQAHDYGAARIAIAQAAAREPTDWQIWLVRARIDAEAGHARAAVRDFRRAHMLDPLSPATAE
jgi:hypothetical protein